MPNTIEITTPAGRKVFIRSFLSYNDLEPSLKLEDNFDKSKEIMKVAIISVDGVSENAYDNVRSLPISEYNFIAKEVITIINGNFPQAK